MTDFYQQVYATVRMIPPGRVTSYGAIARFLGSSGSSRMVGWAMNLSHHQPVYVPAHRVVNRNGLLTGKIHFNPPSSMQELLENEGITVVNDQIVNFKEYFWDPMAEMREYQDTSIKYQDTDIKS